MKKRRQEREDIARGTLAIIILFTIGFTSLANKNPILASILCGATTVLFFILCLLIIQTRKKKKAAIMQASNLILTSPNQFEEAVAELFRQQGYKAQVTPPTNDKGIDILLKRGEQKYVVQCKQWNRTYRVGPEYIRDFIGAMDGMRVREGFFVTTASYTEMAKDAAKKSSLIVHLIDGERLGAWANKISKSYNTDLINAKWWKGISRIEKGFILAITSFCIGVSAFSLSYWLITRG